MSTDDLSAPLGQGKARKRRRAVPWAPIIAAVLALPVVVFAGYAVLRDDPFGGEPIAVSPAVVGAIAANDAPGTELPVVVPAQPAAPAPPPNSKTITIIDGSSGKRREIHVPAAPDAQPAPH